MRDISRFRVKLIVEPLTQAVGPSVESRWERRTRRSEAGGRQRVAGWERKKAEEVAGAMSIQRANEEIDDFGFETL